MALHYGALRYNSTILDRTTTTALSHYSTCYNYYSKFRTLYSGFESAVSGDWDRLLPGANPLAASQGRVFVFQKQVHDQFFFPLPTATVSRGMYNRAEGRVLYRVIELRRRKNTDMGDAMSPSFAVQGGVSVDRSYTIKKFVEGCRRILGRICRVVDHESRVVA